MLLDPADAGAIGVEATVYRLEEGILQVNMARLLSSMGRQCRPAEAGAAAADGEGYARVGSAQNMQEADGGRARSLRFVRNVAVWRNRGAGGILIVRGA